jgi:hypothetical protein
VITRT